MAYSLEDKLVIGITSRALFDLEKEHNIYVDQRLDAYRAYQLEHEEEPLAPGTGFPLVKALLAINERSRDRLVEVVLLSRNDADSGLRIMNSIEATGIDITRAVFAGGSTAHLYVNALSCDLFLSKYEEEVREVLAKGIPAALVYPPPAAPMNEGVGVRIAFDGDAVLFAGDAEEVYQQNGLSGFQEHEVKLAEVPLDPGPFKGFLEALNLIQNKFPASECPIRIALVTSRNAPTHKRAIKTLRAWKVRVDASFFLGGVDKTKVLEVFQPHIFFDDTKIHVESAAQSIPSARVLSQQNVPPA